jgi:hypothetical protein
MKTIKNIFIEFIILLIICSCSSPPPGTKWFIYDKEYHKAYNTTEFHKSGTITYPYIIHHSEQFLFKLECTYLDKKKNKIINDTTTILVSSLFYNEYEIGDYLLQGEDGWIDKTKVYKGDKNDETRRTYD